MSRASTRAFPLSRTSTRTIPFAGAALPRGGFGDIQNNTKAIADAIGILVGTAAAGVGFAAREETQEMREAEAEFEIERAEALVSRLEAKNEIEELELQQDIASLRNKEAAENLARVAELERVGLPAILAGKSQEERIAYLKLYPSMAPENAEHLGAGIGEDLAASALAAVMSRSGNQLRDAIRGLKNGSTGEPPDVMPSLQKWITDFNDQIAGLPDNVRNPAIIAFSGRLRSMAEEELLRGSEQDQSEATEFADTNLRLQIQRLIGDAAVDPSDPVDLRTAVERMAALTGMSTEAVDEKAGEVLRRSVLSRLRSGESATVIQKRLAKIDRRSRIWQSANVGEQGDLDSLVESAVASQQVSADNGLRQHIEALAIDLERTLDIDGLDDLLTELVPQIETPHILQRAKLDVQTRIKVVQTATKERLDADEVMAGTMDGRTRGWTKETLSWMYQREIDKGRQKWDVARNMAERLGMVGPRVVQDIADNFTDGISNTDEGLRMIHSIWQEDSTLAENVLHGLSTWGRAGTAQHQTLRALALWNLAKEQEPGTPEWNRIAELGQRPGFMPGLIEAHNSLTSPTGFPEGSGVDIPDTDEGFPSIRSLLQAEVGALMDKSPGIITPEIITLYQSHYEVAYAREYSETRLPTQMGTAERTQRVEVARTAAADAILGRWVVIDKLMLSSQQLALTPGMARDESVTAFIEESVARFGDELKVVPKFVDGRPVGGFATGVIDFPIGIPMAHRFFSPDNIWTYLPAGAVDGDEARIVAFMAIEPARKERRMIFPSDPKFRSLLRASGIKITTETVGPSARFMWHSQYETRTVEEFKSKWHGDDFVEDFYFDASQAWVDEGDGPPDVDNPAFLFFLNTYAQRHKWHGWMAGPTRRGQPIDPFSPHAEPDAFGTTEILRPNP